jgi:putative cardiolipin synthase
MLLSLLIAGCSQNIIKPTPEQIKNELEQLKFHKDVFANNDEYIGSPYLDIGRSGLFNTHLPDQSQIAILQNGDYSFAARIQALKKADTSIRIQALVFTADESGIYIAEILKKKKKKGLDVRIIVDAFSNPSFQTQQLYFDLKQHGIEVEGYEAMLLQWINEIPITSLMPHAEHGRLNKRFHEKMWLIDAETDHGIAVVGGLNIANEYFRVDPTNADFYWRDQDVIVKGNVIKDMVTAFDRNFDYFLSIKKSRGIFNTNLYWEKTRDILEVTGKINFSYQTEPRLNKKVLQMSKKKLRLDYQPAKVRFFQNRPRYKESYIGQAYLKLILSAKKEILIANAYFVPSEKFILAIKEAARRCVSVKIITNSTETNDLPAITIVGRESYKEMLSVNNEAVVEQCSTINSTNKTDTNKIAGVQIYEWHGKKANEIERTEGTMHSKYAVFDDTISLVASYNLDPRSENLNSESALVFKNNHLSNTLSELFNDNDLLFSEQISLQQAEEFLNPTDTLYRIEKGVGDFFKDDF